MSSKKEYRSLSVEGCESIGHGAHGEVFRLAPDTMVKVYYPHIPIERIQKELAYARKAFVLGVPTAIPFDIVRVGDRFGAVFELLNAVPVSDYIRDDEEKTKEFIEKSIRLLKLVHGLTVKPGELPSMKENTMDWLAAVKEDLDAVIFHRIMELLEDVPDSDHLLHGDVNPGNFMLSGDELMLIDMDTLSVGDPIFELATLFVSYVQFPKINEKSVLMFGLTAEKAARMWDEMLRLYLDTSDEGELAKTEKRAQLFGCLRVIDFMRRHPELEDQKEAIQICMEDIRDAVTGPNY